MKICIAGYFRITLSWNTSQSTLYHHPRGCKDIEEGWRVAERELLSIQVVWLSSCSPESSVERLCTTSQKRRMFQPLHLDFIWERAQTNWGLPWGNDGGVGLGLGHTILGQK